MILDLKNSSTRVLYETQYSEVETAFSPYQLELSLDCLHLERNRPAEIYVRDFPQLTRKWQISSGGVGSQSGAGVGVNFSTSQRKEFSWPPPSGPGQSFTRMRRVPYSGQT